MVEKTKELLLQPRTQENISELFKLNKGLVGKQLQRFGLVGSQDAVSHGYEALYKAIVTFDTSKKVAFSTYATNCIYNRLGDYVRRLHTQININTVSYEATMQEQLFICEDNTYKRLEDEINVYEVEKLIVACHFDFTNPVHFKILQQWRESNFSMSYTEIAQRVGCSQPYVSQTIQRFKIRLKERLHERTNEPPC